MVLKVLRTLEAVTTFPRAAQVKMVLLAVGVVCVASCGAPESGVSAEPESGVSAEVESGGSAATDLPPPPAEEELTPHGWGPLSIGMTLEEVTRAAGEDANPEAVGGPEPEVCDEFRPERAPRGMIVMIERGRLTRISLGSGSEVRDFRGLAVGDSASVVRRAHGEELVASPHKYQEAPAEYLTVWGDSVSAEPRGMVYEVGRHGTVQRIHAGGPSIQYVEGCL